MSDQAGALAILAAVSEAKPPAPGAPAVDSPLGSSLGSTLGARALAAYEAQWGDHREAVDTWLTCQACAPLPSGPSGGSSSGGCGGGALRARLERLMTHKSFSLTNPNKVRAVWGGLELGAPAVLQDPSVLALLGDVVEQVDAANPNLAASLTK